MISRGGIWYDLARLLKSAGYLTGRHIYQEYVLIGMHIFEENDENEKFNNLLENIFMIVQPEIYLKHKEKTDMQRMEEGVDEVIYRGEDSWIDIAQELREFGITDLDLFGKGLRNE